MCSVRTENASSSFFMDWTVLLLDKNCLKLLMLCCGCMAVSNLCVCLPGPGLLSQHGDHAQGCQTPQRHDRPPAEKGMMAPGLTSRAFPVELNTAASVLIASPAVLTPQPFLSAPIHLHPCQEVARVPLGSTTVGGHGLKVALLPSQPCCVSLLRGTDLGC